MPIINTLLQFTLRVAELLLRTFLQLIIAIATVLLKALAALVQHLVNRPRPHVQSRYGYRPEGRNSCHKQKHRSRKRY